MGDGRTLDETIQLEEGSPSTRTRCMPASDDPSDTWRERESSMVGVQRMRDPLRTLPNGGHEWALMTWNVGADNSTQMDRFANWIMREEIRQSTPGMDFEMADPDEDTI